MDLERRRVINTVRPKRASTFEVLNRRHVTRRIARYPGVCFGGGASQSKLLVAFLPVQLVGLGRPTLQSTTYRSGLWIPVQQLEHVSEALNRSR